VTNTLSELKSLRLRLQGAARRDTLVALDVAIESIQALDRTRAINQVFRLQQREPSGVMCPDCAREASDWLEAAFRGDDHP